MKVHAAAVLVAIASSVMASNASALSSHPYFELTGGELDAEMVVSGGNFIPPGALELDSAVVGGVPQPATVYLRDPGFDGSLRRVCVDYIGTDAAFQNRFIITGTTIDWCNKASCTDPTAVPLGIGGLSWTGPFAASACFQMNVGQPVPFVFIADVLNQGGNGTHTIANGEANPNAHWGAFPYPFALSPPMPTASAIIGVGLADGAYDAAADDDHQDLAVRFTVEPGSELRIPTLGEGTLLLLVLAMAAIGSRSAKRAGRSHREL